MAAAVLMMLVICSCNRSEPSSFQREYEAVQMMLPSDAQLVNTSAPRQNGYGMEASWESQLPGNIEAAKQACRARVPVRYELVRETSSEIVYARFDGHDSFHLTFIFNATKPGSTMTTAVLKGVPD